MVQIVAQFVKSGTQNPIYTLQVQNAKRFTKIKSGPQIHFAIFVVTRNFHLVFQEADVRCSRSILQSGLSYTFALEPETIAKLMSSKIVDGRLLRITAANHFSDACSLSKCSGCESSRTNAFTVSRPFFACIIDSSFCAFDGLLPHWRRQLLRKI